MNPTVTAAPPRHLPDHPQERLQFCLEQARAHRHHATCRCRLYEGGYCTAGDALWSRAVDRELDQWLTTTP